MMNTTNETAPANASLWIVDAEGIAVGRQVCWNMPLVEVQDTYRTLVAQGADPRTLRITPAGQRPDSLGRRR
jgi:hypothetical protein